MNPSTLLMLAAGAVTLSAALAALFFGLWMGERGRREDTQRILQVAKADDATVIPPDPPPEEQAKTRATEIDRDQYVQDAMAEGLSKRDAERDWEEAMAQINSIGRRAHD